MAIVQRSGIYGHLARENRGANMEQRGGEQSRDYIGLVYNCWVGCNGYCWVEGLIPKSGKSHACLQRTGGLRAPFDWRFQ